MGGKGGNRSGFVRVPVRKEKFMKADLSLGHSQT